MSRSFMYSVSVVFAASVCAFAGTSALSSSGQNAGLVRLQSSTPGTVQTGHVNLSGTVTANDVQTTHVGAASPSTAVDATSTFGVAISGLGNTTGVVGSATGNAGIGVFGDTASNNGVGVLGQSLGTGPGRIGVHGVVSGSDGFSGLFQGGSGCFMDKLLVGTSVGTGVDIAILDNDSGIAGGLGTVKLMTNAAPALTALTGKVGIGAATAPLLPLSLIDNDSGFTGAAGTVSMLVNNVNKFTATGVGVGFGTATPRATLHVSNGSSGSAFAGSDVDPLIVENNANSFIQFLSPSANVNGLLFGDNALPQQAFVVYNNSTALGGLSFGIEATTRMVLTSAGRVGIANAAPTTALQVVGTITGTTKNFLIDDPSDPANSYLRHSCVESDQYKNIYDGTVTTDAKGFAEVRLPSWFEALNRDFRYQLTVVLRGDEDAFAQAAVVRKIKNGAFRIRTSAPNVEVCWQVTGVRHDNYVEANPLIVQEPKSGADRGRYLNPDVFGLGPESQIGYRKEGLAP